MRKLLPALLLLLVAAVAAAQKVSYSLRFGVSQHDFADTVQVAYDHHRIVVPVSVGGKQLHFLLDTGASQTTIFGDAPIEGTESLGFIASHDAVGRSSDVPVVRMPPMTIGRTTFTGMQAIVQQRTVRRSDIDGIVGFDLVCKGLHLKIDARRGLLILSDRPDSFDDRDAVRLKYRMNYHVPYIDIEPFGGYRERVLFDTGSPLLYAMNRQSFDRCEAATRGACLTMVEGRSMGRHAIGYGGTEQRGETLFLALERLCLGTFALTDVHALTTQGGSHVGGALLDYGTVAFLPQKRRIVFTPYDGAQQATVANRQTDKVVVSEGGRPVVGLVWERSEHYRAGLREGDIITGVDGRQIATMAEYRLYGPKAGQQHTIVVSNAQGERRELKMKW